MNFDRPKNLGKTITVKAANRPIKIAYLVPYEDTGNNQWVIDAVFYESYTRWGGIRTLIIPTSSSGFLYEDYGKWLEFYDPDFIYTYIDLAKELIEKLDHLCCPIAFISYHNKQSNSKATRWQDYLPEWLHYFDPVSSLTTIHSPYADYHRIGGLQKESDKTIITQFQDSETRFLTDNFGTAFDLRTYTNPIKGLFETCCLVPNDLPEHMNAGTTRITSFADVISQIATKKAIPISKLAMIHSKSIPRFEPYSWTQNFNLFVGNTCLDRIHFWNGRNFSPDYIDVPGALLVKKELFEDTEFVNQLGQFLNNHNFLGQTNNPPKVALRSYSLSKEELGTIRDGLKGKTFNIIFLEDSYHNPAIPSSEDFKRDYRDGSADTTIFKVSENINTIQASEPAHFTFTPPRFSGHSKGQWAIDFVVERHNNLSRYSNVVDTWMLPHRKKVTRAFTRSLSKVTRDHLLTILPVTDSNPLWSGPIKNVYRFDLTLPSDEDFFRWLILKFFRHYSDDLRGTLNYEAYEDMALSDKGQNLRGVISMFDNLYEASEFLTNRFWREVIRSSQIGKEKEESKKKIDIKNANHVFTKDKLFGYLPNDNAFKEQVKKELNLGNLRNVNKYLKANFYDSLEFLIEKNVFYQVHQRRCSYCGHINTQPFDKLKRINDCEICQEKYFAPIDLEWRYKLNDFVYRSLCERNGLTVLWTLGYLQHRGIVHSFYYLPEIDLFPNYEDNETKNEIDILCVLEGRFYAVEVKLSAVGFINKPDEIDKFIKKIILIKPDAALLVFERYCESDDIDPTRQELQRVVVDISRKIGDYIKVETVVASNFHEFSDYPVDIGYWGERVNKLFDEISSKKPA